MNLELEERQSISRPTVGRTMLSLLKTQGNTLLVAYNMLKNHLEEDRKGFSDNDYLYHAIHFKFLDSDKIAIEKERYALISISLILNWLCGRISNTVSIDCDLLEAEMNFSGKPSNGCISAKLKPEVSSEVVGHLRNLDIHTLLDAIPYLAEVFETGDENSEQKGAGRTKKRRNGIYYTPTDVVDFIVARSIENRRDKSFSFERLSWLDPALGTGSFLLSVLKYYTSREPLKDIHRLSIYVAQNLFGIDISPFALQSASYILAAYCVLECGEGSLRDMAKIIGANLFLADSTKIATKEKLHEIFPEIGMLGVDFLVSNPPYSKKDKQQLTLFDSKAHNGDSADDLYPDFVRLVFGLTKARRGGGGMVVPLSLCCSSKENFKSLRNHINNKNGLIEFLNFDRTPDSLFGDDVKTRNTIIFYSNSGSCQRDVNTSYLHRWTSRNRTALFDSIAVARLDNDIDITNGVPKIGDQIGANMFGEISQEKYGSLKEIIGRSDVLTELRTKTTAYNWIPVELNEGIYPESTLGRVYWQVKERNISSAMIYAVLSSRFTYWLWRIWGDGFHLTNQFIYDLPFGAHFFESIDKVKLEEMGLKLWNGAKREVIVTKNAGHVTHSYSPLTSSGLVDDIDELLMGFYCFSNVKVDYLRKYVQNLVISGRYQENKTMTKFKNIH